MFCTIFVFAAVLQCGHTRPAIASVDAANPAAYAAELHGAVGAQGTNNAVNTARQTVPTTAAPADDEDGSYW